MPADHISNDPLWPSKGFVFIVSYGRTGSTLLQAMLQSIDGYFIRGENWNTLFPLYRSYQLARHARVHQGHKPLDPSRPWYGADEIEPEEYGQALAQLFVHQILKPPAGQRVIGFKEIRFINAKGDEFGHFLDFMTRVFAPAKFIFNTRSADDVAKSKWWADLPEEKVRATIAEAESQFSRYMAAHPDICYHARYEDFSQGAQAFAPIFEFLGEPFDEAKAAEVLARQYASW